MVLDIILTLFLVFLNGFFVAAEFAIVKVRSSQISLQSGTRSKRAAEIIINNLDGFLAATQLGITLASLGLGWIGEAVVSKIILNTMHGLGFSMSEAAAHNIAFPAAFLFITILHIVFGELAPKSLAIQFPTTTTLAVSLPLRVFYFIFRPFIVLLNGFANLILKAFGIRPVSEQAVHSQEELKLIIAESMEGGEFEAAERDLIQNVFDFDDRVVKQIMVPRVRVSGIEAQSTIDEAVRLCLAEGYSRYPVYNKSMDDVIGVIHAKDLMKHFVDQSGKKLSEIVIAPRFVTGQKRIDHLLREFQKEKIQMAIVVNEYGGTVGMVTLEDILEELVGEIQDEHDREAQIVTVTETGYSVLAKSPIHDINKYTDIPFRESANYDTLAGLLLHYYPSELKNGNEFMAEGYKIKIIKMHRHLPEVVELIRLQEETDDGSSES